MKEIGRNARKFVVENLDWEIIAEKYLKSLKNYTKLIG
jgi:glycosyltransferase involved in cell wall biosynthesis